MSLYIFKWLCEFCGEVHTKAVRASSPKEALNKFVASWTKAGHEGAFLQLPLALIVEVVPDAE